MLAILMFFYLLLPPANHPICTLWIAQPATLDDVAAACPEGITLENYQVDFVNIWNEKVYCTQNATAIYAPYDACGFTETLDNFRLEVYAPANGETVLCSVNSYNNPPTRAEFAAVCSWDAMNAFDEGRAELRYMGIVDQPSPVVIDIPVPSTGTGLYDQPAAVDDLATDESLTWLAGRLIWHNQVQPNCADGFSGLDPVTLAADACGSQSAAPLVTNWQNQFDADIYAAAAAEGVPARLLKRVLKVESQFWPLWDERPAGEVGMAQITAAAADQYLRWYRPGYPYASEKIQIQMQAEFMNALRCQGCSLHEAIQKEHANIPTYARLLKAYRYSAEDWHGALVLWNGSDYANKVEG
jgi:hypothetical protein